MFIVEFPDTDRVGDSAEPIFWPAGRDSGAEPLKDQQPVHRHERAETSESAVWWISLALATLIGIVATAYFWSSRPQTPPMPFAAGRPAASAGETAASNQPEPEAEPDDRITVRVGLSPIQLPTPEGFVDCRTSAPHLFQLGQSMTPPTNELVAFFAPAQLVGDESTGSPPPALRCYAVQTLAQLKNTTVPAAHFQTIQSAVERQLALGLDQVRATTSQFLHAQQAANPLSKHASFQLDSLKPGRVFHRGRESLAFSIVADVRINLAGFQVRSSMAVVSGVCLVRGKILFISAMFPSSARGPDRGAEKTFSAWLKQVIALNR